MTTPTAPSRGLVTHPLMIAAGTLLLAVLIVVGVVLPAEFGRDPLGLGRATGLLRLAETPEAEAYVGNAAASPAGVHAQPFREDIIEIPLGYVGGGVGPYSLEYKVAMNRGAVLLYEWQAVGLDDPSGLAFDFHGHTLPGSPDEKMVVASYRKGRGAAERGSLTAPVDGIHGWYFENRTRAPIVVRLRVIGPYALVAPGDLGNEFGIEPNLPAGQVQPRLRRPAGGQ